MNLCNGHLVSGCIDAYCTNITGSGPPLGSPVDIDVEASGALVVVDNALAAVMRVDRRSGDRSLVSGQGRGGGPSTPNLEGIAVEANGALVVTNSRAGGVVRVDPVSGDRTLVSGGGFERIAVEANGGLLGMNGSIRAVVRVDPATGDRTIVSGANIGSGPLFVCPRDIAVEPDGHLVVIDSLLPGVVRVDLATGDRTIVSRLGVSPAAARAAAGNPRRRPLEDFLAVQRTFCIDDGMGGCFLFIPPVPNYAVGFTAPAQNRCTVVDYASGGNAWVEEESQGSVSFETEIGSLVIKSPLVNGRAKVMVLLSAKNALTWVIECSEVSGDFATSPLLFGHRAQEVLFQGKKPALHLRVALH